MYVHHSNLFLFLVILMEKLVEFMSSNCDRAVFELGKHCLAN